MLYGSRMSKVDHTIPNSYTLTFRESEREVFRSHHTFVSLCEPIYSIHYQNIISSLVSDKTDKTIGLLYHWS